MNDKNDPIIGSMTPAAGVTVGATVAPRMNETEHIMQFFSYDHLPSKLGDVSRPFGELAVAIVATLPRNPERTVALRKLLEAKDAAVRAFIAK